MTQEVRTHLFLDFGEFSLLPAHSIGLFLRKQILVKKKQNIENFEAKSVTLTTGQLFFI